MAGRPRTAHTQPSKTYPDRIADVYAHISDLNGKIAQCTTDANGCIIWDKFGRHKQGYGMVGAWSIPKNKKIMHTVHRLLMKIKTNTDLKGKDVFHTCGNMSCVNIDHISVGTTSELMINVMHRVQQNGPIKHYKATNGIRPAPQNRKYRYAPDDIISVYHNQITVEEWSAKYHMSRHDTQKMFWEIRAGRWYKWVRFTKKP